MYVDGQYVKEINSAGVERRAYAGQNGRGIYDGDTAHEFDEHSAGDSFRNAGIRGQGLREAGYMEPLDQMIAEEIEGRGAEEVDDLYIDSAPADQDIELSEADFDFPEVDSDLVGEEDTSEYRSLEVKWNAHTALDSADPDLDVNGVQDVFHDRPLKVDEWELGLPSAGHKRHPGDMSHDAGVRQHRPSRQLELVEDE